MEDEIRFVTALIADPKLTKGASLGSGCSCITSVVFKVLVSSTKL